MWGIVEGEISVVPRYDQMRCVVAVGKKGQAPRELYYPSDGTSVFSDTGELLNTFSRQSMYNPCGIALHRNNIYVTSRDTATVCHFKMEQQILHVATFGSSRGSSDYQLTGHPKIPYSQFNNPLALTISTDGSVYEESSRR